MVRRNRGASKPSFIAGNPGRFNPVGSVQLGDGLGEIVAYGPLCQSQRTRQFSGSFTVASAAQDQTLSIGEGVFFRAPYLGGPSRLYEGSRTMIQGAIDELVKRAKKSGDLRRELDAFDLLRALIGVSHVGSGANWQQSARRLVDILIAGSRPLK